MTNDRPEDKVNKLCCVSGISHTNERSRDNRLFLHLSRGGALKYHILFHQKTHPITNKDDPCFQA